MSARSIQVKKNARIEVIDTNGQQVVDFFATCIENEHEFLSTGATIDSNESIKIGIGSVLYTNLYNKMFTVVADDVGEHDLLHPCCSPAMFDFFYGFGAGHPNCLDNINNALGTLSFAKRAEITPLNIFMHTSILPNGKISVEAPLSKAGDKIVLRAEMDVVVIAASCSVSESKCNAGTCSPIQIVIVDEGVE